MIRESKFNRDRLIPMAQSLTDILRVYHAKKATAPRPEEHFFINKAHTALTRDDIYKRFRDILWKAGISHGGRGKGPRLHDISYPNLNKIQTFFKKAGN